MAIPQPPAQKFLFNRSFDNLQAESAQPKEPPPPTYSQADLDSARESAMQQGFAAGQDSAQQTQQAQLLSVTETLATQIAAAFDAAAANRQAQEQDIGDIALAIARRLLPEIVSENALQTVSGMVAQVCKDMAREPRLVVRVPDALLDPLQQQLSSITQQQAYAGKIVLLADDTLHAGDCKIEWSDGGIECSSAAIWQQIDEAVRQAKVLARNGELPSPSPQSPSVQE